MVLLDRSLEPSVLGWKDVDIFSFTPVNFVSAFQNLKINSLSRLQTMLSGSPFSQYQLLKKSSASSSVVILILVGIIQMSVPRQLVTDNMQLYLLSTGSRPIKSMVILLAQRSGTGKGCSGLAGFVVQDLFCRQSMHEGMYASSRSQHMFGQ